MEGTFCFVDIAGFTALTEAHGAETAADLVDRFTALVQNAIGATPGRLVDRIGDAAFVFTSRPEAGIAFLEKMFALAAAEPNFPILRAGLHHGEALERNGSYYGATINLAARVAAQARGSQALGTAIIAETARRAGVIVESLGIFTLRNVREPVELYALNLHAKERPDAIDPVCRMSLRPETATGRLRHEGIDYWFCSIGCAGQFAENPPAFVAR